MKLRQILYLFRDGIDPDEAVTKRQLSASFGQFKPTGYLVSNINLAAAASYTSGDIRGTTGIPADAVGVWLSVLATSAAAAGGPWADLYVDSADAVPDSLSARLRAPAGTAGSVVIPVTLGTGVNAGQFKLVSQVDLGVNGIYVWAVAFWR